MNFKTKTVFILISIVVVALLAVLWSLNFESRFNFEPPSNFDPLNFPWRDRPVPLDRIRGDIEIFYLAKTVVSSVNALLLCILLVTYVNLYRKIKSEFTVGLIMFSMILLLYALVSNPILQYIFGFQAFGLGPFAMLPDLFALIALAVLLYLTLKY